MENQIEKIIKQLAARMGVREATMYALFYETGLDYLEQLKQRITNAEYLKLQFGPLLSSGALNMSPEKAFQKIETSPLFWGWWATTLWGVYSTNKPNYTNELSIRAMFVADLIPINLLTKIFENGNIPQQKRQSRYVRPKAAECYA
jgi:hypothetical protein